jgi:hypothetical protein
MMMAAPECELVTRAQRSALSLVDELVRKAVPIR